MHLRLGAIAGLLVITVALSATGLVRVFHLQTAHESPSSCATDSCVSLPGDSDRTSPEQAPDLPAPSETDEECPECHLLASSARAMVIWTVATIVLDAPGPAFVEVEQRRTPDCAVQRSHPARGPPTAG